MSHNKSKNAGIDLRETYQDKIQDAIESVCKEHGFDMVKIDFGAYKPAEGSKLPSRLSIIIELGPKLPRFEIMIHPDGTVDAQMVALNSYQLTGKHSLDSAEMDAYMDHLQFLNGLAKRIEAKCKVPLKGMNSKWDDTNWSFLHSPELEVLDQEGGVKDTEYVRGLVRTVFDGLKEREGRYNLN